MKFTIPIELVVDGEQVAREQAAMEPVAIPRQDKPKRKKPVRLLGLRPRNSRSIRVLDGCGHSKPDVVHRRG